MDEIFSSINQSVRGVGEGTPVQSHSQVGEFFTEPYYTTLNENVYGQNAHIPSPLSFSYSICQYSQVFNVLFHSISRYVYILHTWGIKSRQIRQSPL